MPTIRIEISGNIGIGKSTVAALLAQYLRSLNFSTSVSEDSRPQELDTSTFDMSKLDATRAVIEINVDNKKDCAYCGAKDSCDGEGSWCVVCGGYQ